MKKVICFLFGIAVLLGSAISCSKENYKEPEPVDPYFEKEGLEPHYDELHFTTKVAYLGGLKERDEAWIRARAAGNLCANPEEGQVIILGNSVVEANLEALNEAYDNGKIIIICYPDFKYLDTVKEDCGWDFVSPTEVPTMDVAIGFSQRASILIKAPVWVKTGAEEATEGETQIISGSEVYEDASVFQSAAGLMDFIDDVLESRPDGTKSSVSARSLSDIANEQTHTFVRTEYWETHLRGRHLRVFTTSTVSYSVFPCYVPEGITNHGDHYVVKAVATNYCPKMYEYKYEDGPTKPYKGKKAHYWAREYSYWGNCQFRGPYNTEMTVSSSVDIPTDMSFPTSGKPKPDSDISTTHHTESVTASWNVGLSGGWNSNDEFSLGFNAGIGGSKTYSVSYDTKDLKVANESDPHSPSYRFIYQNLPKEDDDFDNYESKMPTISKSTASFDMSWQWVTSNPKADYDKFVYTLSNEVGWDLSIWSRDRNGLIWSNYMYSFHRSSTLTNKEVMSVARVPVGCLRIENKCQNNQMLYGIFIKDETNKTVYKSSNNLAQGEFLEVLLPKKNHTYSVNFNMGKSSDSTIPYYSNDSKITLPLLVDSKSDKRVLNATESGGDFTTDAGMIRVVNQSSGKLVMHLTVYRKDGTLVLEYPNSLGYNVSVDLYVTAGQEYYVKMDYGSESSSKPYRSANDFLVSSYKSETDIKILYAADNGGNFVLD